MEPEGSLQCSQEFATGLKLRTQEVKRRIDSNFSMICTPNIIRSMRYCMRWAGHVTRMRDKK
jgi:hypothetical protein